MLSRLPAGIAGYSKFLSMATLERLPISSLMTCVAKRLMSKATAIPNGSQRIS
jgi:hypothetical protein